ncbi:MAG: cytochrome b [Sphingomicrobium sp.]
MTTKLESVPQAVPQQRVLRYSNTAVAIHWVTVVLVLFQIWLGLSFADMAQGPARGELFTWHKTIGALILLATIGRLTYRLMNPPPPFPTDLPKWERVTAVWNHRLFYLLLIGLPIGGLIAVSARAKGPTTELLGGIPLPVIPGISRQMGEIAGGMHSLFAFILIALIIVHAAAALKHQFFDRAPASGRMPPFRPPHGEPVVIGQGGDRSETD